MTSSPQDDLGDELGEDNEPVDLAPAAPSGTAAAPQPTAAAKADALGVARERILAALREHHTIKPQLAWALLLGGASLMLVIGVVLSFAMWLLSIVVVGGDAAMGIRAWLVVYILLVVPVVVWVDRRARSGFFSLMSADVDLTRDVDNNGDYLLQRSAAHATSVMNVLMFGPRAFIAGLHALRNVPLRGLELVLPEAADTLTLMLSIDGGVKIAALAAPGADPLSLMPVLKWLDLHDYIGISSKGDRVWVSSPAKKRFAEAGIQVPKLEAAAVPTP